MFGTLPAWGFYCRHVRGLTSWDDVVTSLLTEAQSTVADASAPAGELP